MFIYTRNEIHNRSRQGWKHIFSYLPILMVGCGFFFSLSGCTSKQDQKTAITKKAERYLNLFNWENYIGSHTIEDFEKEKDIKVKEINFKDEEEMLGAVQSKPGHFDLTIISGDVAREMIKAKLVSPLNYTKIPNFKYIDKEYTHTVWDQEQKFIVPYFLGSTGLVINKKFIKEENINSWRVLWNKEYKGKLAMLNNCFEVFSAGCKLLGYSINTSNPDELTMVRNILLEQKALLHGYYDPQTVSDLLINEQVWSALLYSGDALMAQEENKDLEYIIPHEGSSLWLDFMVILRDGKNKEEAHEFINYIIRPEVMASIASELWYATPNSKAKLLMDPEVSGSPFVYPPHEVMDRCEFFKNKKETNHIVLSVWSELMRE